MYRTRYQLSDRPFRCSPSLDAYYPATVHERALESLVRGVRDQEGMLLLCGAPGVGKTLLCQRLMDTLADEFSIAFLTNGRVHTSLGLLQSILFDLGLAYEGKPEAELKLALTEHVFKLFGEGKPTLIVIDEAHHLEPEQLEELRMLSNLESRRVKVVQIVLCAQPGVLNTLRHPLAAAVHQRLGVRVALDSLGIEEAGDYILHQLRVVGGGNLFTDDAVELIARETQGVPRLINQVAHDAMILACQADADQVDVEAAMEALSMHGLGADALDTDSDGDVALYPVQEVSVLASPRRPA